MGPETLTESRPKPDSSLQPWQFFVLAALGCATALTFLVRSHGVTAVILLSAIMGATPPTSPSPRTCARNARRQTIRMRGFVRIAAPSYDIPKFFTTEDTEDTEHLRVFPLCPLCPLCPPWWRFLNRSDTNARPEGNV